MPRIQNETKKGAGPVTTQVLAREYGVSKNTIIRWYEEGIIPALVAIGETYRWDRDAVAKALRVQQEKERMSRLGVDFKPHADDFNDTDEPEREGGAA